MIRITLKSPCLLAMVCITAGFVHPHRRSVPGVSAAHFSQMPLRHQFERSLQDSPMNKYFYRLSRSIRSPVLNSNNASLDPVLRQYSTDQLYHILNLLNELETNRDNVALTDQDHRTLLYLMGAYNLS